jgi:hypothetical protein
MVLDRDSRGGRPPLFLCRYHSHSSASLCKTRSLKTATFYDWKKLGQQSLGATSVDKIRFPLPNRRLYDPAAGGILDGSVEDPLVVPVTSALRLDATRLICKPARSRVWWLRGIAATAIRIAMP